MNTKTSLTAGLIVISVLLVNFGLILPAEALGQAAKLRELDVTYDEETNTCRITLQGGEQNESTVKCLPGDTISWTTNTDVYFQFPDASSFDPLSSADAMVDDYRKFVAKDSTFSVLVSSVETPNPVKVYAVFCISAGDYALGESPPKIIIHKTE